MRNGLNRQIYKQVIHSVDAINMHSLPREKTDFLIARAPRGFGILGDFAREYRGAVIARTQYMCNRLANLRDDDYERLDYIIEGVLRDVAA